MGKSKVGTYSFSLVAGIIFLVVSSYFFEKSYTFVQNSEVTVGVVSKLKHKSKRDPIKQRNKGVKRLKTTYYPVITFRDRDNNEVTFVSDLGREKGAQSVGDEVEIFFNPDNPKDAEINSFFSLWMLPTGLLFFGIVFFTYGYYGKRRS